MRSLFARAKDAALEKALLLFAGPKIERYGAIKSFHLNSSERAFSAEVELHGETAPLLVSEGRYRIEDRAGELFVIISGLKVSRPWLQNVLDDHLKEIPLKLPAALKPMLG